MKRQTFKFFFIFWLKIYVNRFEKTFIFKGFQAAFSFCKFHRKAFLGEVFFYTNRLDLKVEMKNYVTFSLFRSVKFKKTTNFKESAIA